MKIVTLIAAMLLMLSPGAISMTVDEAYQSIPHARTVFRPETSNMPRDEKRVLAALFGLIDEAIVLRVEAFRSRSAKKDEYASLKRRLASTEVPGRLQKIRKLVLGAVEDQESYLKKIPKQVNASDKEVRSASGKLHAAYSELMGLYPNENAHNRQAFFDYLCALDFI